MAKLESTIRILDMVVRLMGPLVMDAIKAARELKAIRDRGGDITAEDWAQSDVEFEAAADALEAALAGGDDDADDTSP